MHMNPQIRAGLKELAGVRHPERLLRLPHSLPFNGRPSAQERRLGHLSKDPNVRRISIRGRLRRDKSVVHCPKLDEICNVQRREAEGPGDEISGDLVFPRDEVLDPRRVVLRRARQKPIVWWIRGGCWGFYRVSGGGYCGGGGAEVRGGRGAEAAARDVADGEERGRGGESAGEEGRRREGAVP